jgi:hypothetical protein
VPTHAQLNAMVARGEAEREEFDRMDAQLEWPSLEGARACLFTSLSRFGKSPN